ENEGGATITKRSAATLERAGQVGQKRPEISFDGAGLSFEPLPRRSVPALPDETGAAVLQQAEPPEGEASCSERQKGRAQKPGAASPGPQGDDRGNPGAHEQKDPRRRLQEGVSP